MRPFYKNYSPTFLNYIHKSNGMMNRNILLLLAICTLSTTGLYAQSAKKLEKSANELYEQGKFAEAAQTYETAWQKKKNPVTVLHMEIFPNGRIRERKIVKKSTDSRFDNMVLSAVDQAQPLPVPDDPGPNYRLKASAIIWHAGDGVNAAPDAMRFMDWTPSPAASDGLPPSFLYAMLLPGGQVFVEETVLVGRPQGGDPGEWFEPLRARLHARLPSLARGPAPRELERCVIAMGSPLPRRGQPTLAFGAAASFVHPATGYMLGVMLQRRERVATAIAEARAAGLVGAAARRVVEPAIWSASERRAWQLYAFGMAVLVDLDHAGVERFFAEFFALPPARWRGFLAGSDATSTLMATMLQYYARAAPPIRRRLTAHLLGRDGLRLARNLV